METVLNTMYFSNSLKCVHFENKNYIDTYDTLTWRHIFNHFVMETHVKTMNITLCQSGSV